MPWGGTGGGPGSSVGGASGDNGNRGGNGGSRTYSTPYGDIKAYGYSSGKSGSSGGFGNTGGGMSGGSSGRQSNGGNDRSSNGGGNKSTGDNGAAARAAAAAKAAADAAAAKAAQEAAARAAQEAAQRAAEQARREAEERARQEAIQREQQRVAQVQQITEETQTNIQTYNEQQNLYNQAMDEALSHKAQMDRTTAGFDWGGGLKDAALGGLMGFLSGGVPGALVGSIAALGKDYASYAIDRWGDKAVTDPTAKVNAAVAAGTMRPDEAAKATMGFNPLNNGRVAGSMLDHRTGPGGVFSNPTSPGGNNAGDRVKAVTNPAAPKAPTPAAPAPVDVQAKKAVETILPMAAKQAVQANDRGTKSYMAELRNRYNAASLLGGNTGVNTSLLGMTAGGQGAIGGTSGRLLTSLGGGGNLLGGAAWQ